MSPHIVIINLRTISSNKVLRLSRMSSAIEIMNIYDPASEDSILSLILASEKG